MMTTPRKTPVFHAVRLAFALSVVTAVLAVPTIAQAAQTCGSSSGHTICVTVSGTTLTGRVQVTVTNSPNAGDVFYTWDSSGPNVRLMEQDGPSPDTGDYSFTWPTEKYLDGTGSLLISAELKTATPVTVSGLTLSNGNSSDIQHTPNDWQTYLPGPWSQPADATILAAGDGPDGLGASKSVASGIAAADPPLFLYLGDIYEKGSFTENLNHYGVSSLDVPGGGTLWGAFADVTQPTLGNHEGLPDWTDYFHQRHTFTAFTFGGVLFIDLDSNASFAVGSQEYTFVQNLLATAPPCVVAFEHHPIFKNSNDDPNLISMWPLLANNGGDLLLTGHTHTMSEYVPLDAAGQPGGHMVQLIAGSGGHSLGSTQHGTRVAWSQGGTPGFLSLALNGSANGGTATALSWAFKDASGANLRTGGVDCGGGGSSGPSVFGFNPTSGPAGTPVDITGSGFTGASDVTFGGVSAGPGGFTVNSDTDITATVPAAAITGPVCVTVGASTGCSSTSFTVNSGGSAPTITNFTPTSGGEGTIVTVNGTNFTSSAVVKFNGLTGTGFVFKSATKVKAHVPAGATTGPISVTTAFGTGTSATDFTVLSGGSAPTITNFTPTSGPVGTLVTINGTNFTGASLVKFNGAIATSFTVVSATEIRATVPAGAATTGKIIVKTPTGKATSPTKFTVT